MTKPAPGRDGAGKIATSSGGTVAIELAPLRPVIFEAESMKTEETEMPHVRLSELVPVADSGLLQVRRVAARFSLLADERKVIKYLVSWGAR